jgi:hypothetical protein
MARFVKCLWLFSIAAILVIAYSPNTEAAKWTYHPRFCNGDLTVHGTIFCHAVEPPLFEGYVTKCHKYSGSLPFWANDYRTIFAWDFICGNVDTTKHAVPYWDVDRWRLRPLADWLDMQPDSLVLPVIGDSTGVQAVIHVIVDLSEWAADPRPLQDSYVIVDGECDDLPGYLVGTTMVVFDSLGMDPFSTDPYTGTLYRHAETIFCCQYTAVKLGRLEATMRGRAVEIAWSTETETDCAGFNIYRSRSKDGEPSLLSRAMIAARGDGVKGADYSFIDTGVVSGGTYYYWLEDIDLDGTVTSHGPVSISVDGVVTRPVRLFLAQNRPNPFGASTEIEYGLPTACKMKLAIFNLIGQQVRTLVDDYQPAGYRAVTWDGTDDSGTPVSPGVYYYKVEAGTQVETRIMVYMK